MSSENSREELQSNREPQIQNQSNSPSNVQVQETLSQSPSGAQETVTEPNLDQTVEQNNIVEEERIESSSERVPQERLEQVERPATMETEQIIVEDIDDLEESQRRLRNSSNERVEIEEVTESDNVVNSGPEPVITESEEPSESPTIRESASMFTEIKTVILRITFGNLKKN